MADCFRQTVKHKGVLGLWRGLTPSLLKIVPYFGVMFSTFEFCKRVCLYRNGYIQSPLNYKLTPGVDQSLHPQELRELKLLRRENFEPRKSALENWHQSVHCRYRNTFARKTCWATGTDISVDFSETPVTGKNKSVLYLLNGFKEYVWQAHTEEETCN